MSKGVTLSSSVIPSTDAGRRFAGHVPGPTGTADTLRATRGDKIIRAAGTPSFDWSQTIARALSHYLRA